MVRCFQLCVSQAEERGDSLEDEAAEEGVPQYGELREQDRFLPIANVARIMKKAIPAQVLNHAPWSMTTITLCYAALAMAFIFYTSW